MTDTVRIDADAIVADAQRALAAIDDEITQMREQKAGLGQRIAHALEQRKLYVRIVAAAKPRTRKSNGDA